MSKPQCRPCLVVVTSDYMCNRYIPNPMFIYVMFYYCVACRHSLGRLHIINVIIIIIYEFTQQASLLNNEHTPVRSLRSGSAYKLLNVPRSSSRDGDRAFCITGPKYWKALPITIKKSPSTHLFNSQIKTHLFSSMFSAQKRSDIRAL